MVTPTDQGGQTQQDFIIIRHPDASSSKFPVPSAPGSLIRVGRELDNDIILVDPKASRYHLELRRNESGGFEVSDVDSANGSFIEGEKLEPNNWITLSRRDTLRVGDTSLRWEKASSMEQTVSMAPINAPAQSESSSTSDDAPEQFLTLDLWAARPGYYCLADFCFPDAP